MVTMHSSYWQSATVLVLVAIISTNFAVVSSDCSNRSGFCTADNRVDRQEREVSFKERHRDNAFDRSFRDSLRRELAADRTRNTEYSREEQRRSSSNTRDYRTADEQTDRVLENRLGNRNLRSESERLETNLRRVNIRNEIPRASRNVLREQRLTEERNLGGRRVREEQIGNKLSGESRLRVDRRVREDRVDRLVRENEVDRKVRKDLVGSRIREDLERENRVDRNVREDRVNRRVKVNRVDRRVGENNQAERRSLLDRVDRQVREDRVREDRVREDRVREDRVREDRVREDRVDGQVRVDRVDRRVGGNNQEERRSFLDKVDRRVREGVDSRIREDRVDRRVRVDRVDRQVEENNRDERRSILDRVDRQVREDRLNRRVREDRVDRRIREGDRNRMDRRVRVDRVDRRVRVDRRIREDRVSERRSQDRIDNREEFAVHERGSPMDNKNDIGTNGRITVNRNERRETRRLELDARSNDFTLSRLERSLERNVRNIDDDSRRSYDRRETLSDRLGNENQQRENRLRRVEQRKDFASRQTRQDRRDIQGRVLDDNQRRNSDLHREDSMRRYSIQSDMLYVDRQNIKLKQSTGLYSPTLTWNVCQTVLVAAIVLQLFKYKNDMGELKSFNGYMNNFPFISPVKAL